MMFDFGTLFTSFVVVEWVIRVVMLFVIPMKQRTSTANAWLLLVMIAPFAGTLLYYAFGNPKLPKQRLDRLKTVKSLTDTELTALETNRPQLFANIKNIEHRQIARLVTKLGGLPPMQGNNVEFLREYDAIFTEIAKAIDKAEDFVHVAYFIAAVDASTQPVFDALVRAAQRGVTVRFMYDRVISRRHGDIATLRETLDSSGVQVHEMLPLRLLPGATFTRPDLRNHRKVVVVDGHTAFAGSQNLVEPHYRIHKELRYKDVVAKLHGSIVWQLNNVFRSDWFAETAEPLSETVEDVDVPKRAGSVAAQVLPSGPSHEYDNNLKLYTAMVHTAKTSVRIVVPYFIPDESLLKAITTAAQRGVDVTIINSEMIDKYLAGYAQRSYYAELLDAGVNIRLYKRPAFLHAKHMIIDEEVAIFGSSNLDIRSFELNFELNMIVYDASVVKQLVAIEQDFIAQSTHITKESWSERRLLHKVFDRFARLASALL